ncbi:hypothetical protein SLA2020_475250 [Shorea laevis]
MAEQLLFALHDSMIGTWVHLLPKRSDCSCSGGVKMILLVLERTPMDFNPHDGTLDARIRRHAAGEPSVTRVA